MVRKLVLVGDPILRQKCRSVSDFSYLRDLLEDMNTIMIASNGIGLAANQVGESLMVFILKKDSTYETFVNPEMISGDAFITFDGEACLSIPGASASTKRYNYIKLRWQDINGITTERDFYGKDAVAVQHEMDHLSGKLYIDQFGSLKKEMLLKKHSKYMKHKQNSE